MSVHQSFGNAVANWLEGKKWPRGATEAQSILSIAKTSCHGTVFEFQSAFGHIQIEGAYVQEANALVDVNIRLVALGHHKAVTIADATCYPVSTVAGTPITFDLENGYVKGSVSFKYDNLYGQRDILATYSLHLPYAEDAKGIVNIAPSEVTESTGFTLEQIKEIPHFTATELKAVEEKARSRPKPGQLTLNGEHGKKLSDEQDLLVKFLKDFVVDHESVVIETYYPAPSSDNYALTTDSRAEHLSVTRAGGGLASQQWHATIAFEVLQLVASVEPAKLAISASLNAKIPLVPAHVHLVEVQGSLLGEGVKVDVNVVIAKGIATFTAEKNKGGKYELYVVAELDIKHLHPIKTGKKRIATLPF